MLDKLIKLLWVVHPRSGTPDTMLTLAVLSTLAVLLKFIVSGVVLKYGDKTLTCGVIDPLAIAAILTPTLTAYVQRKKLNPPEKGATNVDGAV